VRRGSSDEGGGGAGAVSIEGGGGADRQAALRSEAGNTPKRPARQRR